MPACLPQLCLRSQDTNPPPSLLDMARHPLQHNVNTLGFAMTSKITHRRQLFTTTTAPWLGRKVQQVWITQTAYDLSWRTQQQQQQGEQGKEGSWVASDITCRRSRASTPQHTCPTPHPGGTLGRSLAALHPLHPPFVSILNKLAAPYPGDPSQAHTWTQKPLRTSTRTHSFSCPLGGHRERTEKSVSLLQRWTVSTKRRKGTPHSLRVGGCWAPTQPFPTLHQPHKLGTDSHPPGQPHRSHHHHQQQQVPFLM